MPEPLAHAPTDVPPGEPDASQAVEALGLSSLYLAKGLELVAEALDAIRSDTDPAPDLQRSLECLAGAGLLCLAHLDDVLAAARAEEAPIAEG